LFVVLLQSKSNAAPEVDFANNRRSVEFFLV
jgi:hypothetical protein